MKHTEQQIEASRIARLIVDKGTITAAAMLAREIVMLNQTIRVFCAAEQDEKEMVN